MGNTLISDKSSWDRHSNNQDLLSVPARSRHHSYKDHGRGSSFLVRSADRIYPEFMVYYTVNDVYERYSAEQERRAAERRRRSEQQKRTATNSFDWYTDEDL